MERREACFYKTLSGEVPALEWLRQLKARNDRAFGRCWYEIDRLVDLGSSLRRSEVDFLRDGIYELRIRSGNVHSRSTTSKKRTTQAIR